MTVKNGLMGSLRSNNGPVVIGTIVIQFLIVCCRIETTEMGVGVRIGPALHLIEELYTKFLMIRSGLKDESGLCRTTPVTTWIGTKRPQC